MRDLFLDIARVTTLVEEVDKASPTDIDKLIELQQKLAVYGYHIAEHVGILHENYVTLEYSRRKSYGEYLRDSKESITKAKEMYYIENDSHHLEKQAESNYKRTKMMLDQIQNVCTTLSIKISYLKQEKNNSKKLI